MTAVTPTDRPKSVRYSCVIKVFCGVFMLSRCFLDCSVGVEVFVTGLSQISSFFSYFSDNETSRSAFCIDNPQTSNIASIDHYSLVCCIFPQKLIFRKV